MRFCALYIYALNLLVATPASATPLFNCPEAFERMFPSEIAKAVSQMPDLAFLPPEKVRQVQEAESAILSTQTSYDIIPQLRDTVGFLQVERRDRLRRIESLREHRRLKRAKILDDKVGEEETLQLRQKKNAIDEEIKTLQTELTAITGHLVPMRNQLGRTAIEAAASSTAKKTGMLILLRNTLINAAGQLAHKGVGKGLSVKFHSAQDGVIAGLIPYQQRLSRKVASKGPAEIARMQKLVEEAIEKGEVIKVQFRVGTMVAVEREGEVKFVNITFEHVDDADIVEIIATFDDNWQPRLLTSDVDPLAFGRRSDLLPEIPRDSPSRGVITPSEREAVRIYNREASSLLGKEKGTFMAHGAENRNPNSSGVSGYPITAHYPDGRMTVIEQGPPEDPDRHLKAFFLEAEREGFHLDVNPLWGWPDDLSATLPHGTAEN